MAAAAPWVQEDAALYTRLALGNETVEGLDGQRVDAYVEYGLTSKLTVTGKYERVAYSDAADFDTDGWRSSLRYQVFRLGSIHASVEAGLLKGAAIGGRNGCDTLGGELRSGLAWSGEWRNRDTFLFGEVAGRFHSDCQGNRMVAGIGQQTSDHIWTITQVWIERGDTNANSDKFQTEILWRTDPVDLSFGYRRENGGLFEEESVFLAFARQF